MSFRKNQWNPNNDGGSSGNNRGRNNNNHNNGRNDNSQRFSYDKYFKIRGATNNNSRGPAMFQGRYDLFKYGGGGSNSSSSSISNQQPWHRNSPSIGQQLQHSLPSNDISSSYGSSYYQNSAWARNRTSVKWHRDNFNTSTFYPQQQQQQQQQQFNEAEPFYNDELDEIKRFRESRGLQNVEVTTHPNVWNGEMSSDSMTTNTNQQDVPPVPPPPPLPLLPECESETTNTDDHVSGQLGHCKSPDVDVQPVANSVRPEKVRSAEEVTKKLINELASMDKHNLKQMINNPNSKYDTALQSHARKKNREEVRKQLRIMSQDQETTIEPDECIDAEKIPNAVFEEIERVLEVNLYSDRQSSSTEKLVCPDDILLRADQILMENNELLLERLPDTADISMNTSRSYNNEPTDAAQIKAANNAANVSIRDDLLPNAFMHMLEKEIDQDISIPNLGNVSCLTVDLKAAEEVQPTPVLASVALSVGSVRSPEHLQSLPAKHVDDKDAKQDSPKKLNTFVETTDQLKRIVTVASPVRTFDTKQIDLSRKPTKTTVANVAVPAAKQRSRSPPINKTSQANDPTTPATVTKKPVDLKTKLQNLKAIKEAAARFALKAMKTYKPTNSAVDMRKHLFKTFDHKSEGRGSTKSGDSKRRRSPSADRMASSSTTKSKTSTAARTTNDERDKKNHKRGSKIRHGCKEDEKTPNDGRRQHQVNDTLDIDDALSNIYKSCMVNLKNLKNNITPCDMSTVTSTPSLPGDTADTMENNRLPADISNVERPNVVDTVESAIDKDRLRQSPSANDSKALNSFGITLVKLSDLMVPTIAEDENGLLRLTDVDAIDATADDAATPSEPLCVLHKDYEALEMVVAESKSIEQNADEHGIEAIAIVPVKMDGIETIASSATESVAVSTVTAETISISALQADDSTSQVSLDIVEHVTTLEMSQVPHSTPKKISSSLDNPEKRIIQTEEAENEAIKLKKQAKKAKRKANRWLRDRSTENVSESNVKSSTLPQSEMTENVLEVTMRHQTDSLSTLTTQSIIDDTKPNDSKRADCDETNGSTHKNVDENIVNTLEATTSRESDSLSPVTIPTDTNDSIRGNCDETNGSTTHKNRDGKFVVVSNADTTTECTTDSCHTIADACEMLASEPNETQCSASVETTKPNATIKSLIASQTADQLCASKSSPATPDASAIPSAPILPAVMSTSHVPCEPVTAESVRPTTILPSSTTKVTQSTVKPLPLVTKMCDTTKSSGKTENANKYDSKFAKNKLKHKCDGESSGSKNKRRHRNRSEREESVKKKVHRLTDEKSPRHNDDDVDDDDVVVKPQDSSTTSAPLDHQQHHRKSKVSDLQQQEHIPRLWRSPGEKKIIEPMAASPVKDGAHHSDKKKPTPTELERVKKTTHKEKIKSAKPKDDSRSALNSKVLPGSSHIVSTSTATIEQRHTVTVVPDQAGSDPILYRMKEIDLKLMEYQQTKMTIDEIILKHQKEKMFIDQMTMRLQNERFQLLSTMLANSNNNNLNAHSQMLLSGALTSRPLHDEPLTIVVPSDVQQTTPDASIIMVKNKHKDSIAAAKTPISLHKVKKRSAEPEHKSDEHRSKKIKPNESSHKKSGNSSSSSSKHKSKKASESIVRSSAVIQLTVGGHTENVKSASQIREFVTALPRTLVQIEPYRHLITKNCRIQLKRMKSDVFDSFLTSKSVFQSQPMDPAAAASSTTTICTSGTIAGVTNEGASKEQPIVDDCNLEDIISEAGGANGELAVCDASSSEAEVFEGFGGMQVSTFDGRFVGHRMPIAFLQVIGSWLVAASEDGNIYKYNIHTGQLDGTFTHHTKTVTAFITFNSSVDDEDKNTILSVSLDGSLCKLQLENFSVQIAEFKLAEPLQVIEFGWNNAFIGSRSGKIYVYDTKIDQMNEEHLCSVGKSIMALKCTREGPRNIIIVSSRTNHINVRDAQTGLLLRTIEVPDKVTIYSFLLDGGIIHCGTNQNKVISYEFTNGNEIGRKRVGIGSICVRLFGDTVIMCGCYDGIIYAYDKVSGANIHQMQGPGKMLLHFDIVNNMIIGASKDNKVLRIWDVPDEIISYATCSKR